MTIMVNAIIEKQCKETESVEERINLILSDDKTICDGTQEGCSTDILPDFYDEIKFKRGQQFFHKHLFSMLVGKLMGLMTIISTPNILNILIFTKMSSDTMTAYKRYMATIFHMCVWYEKDFTTGSKLWASIQSVKCLHNSASNRSSSKGGQKILQKDMAVTQFGFMGYMLVRPEYIGIHRTTKDEIEGFVHLWRVIGHIMGIHDRFNICRNNLEETKLMCEALVQHVFIPNINRNDPEYLKMADALVSGMWVMQPMLQTKVFSIYMNTLLNESINNNELAITYEKLSLWETFLLNLLKYYFSFLKFTLMRLYSNAKIKLSLWLMRNFPFLAYYKYGYKNSYVTIYLQRGKH